MIEAFGTDVSSAQYLGNGRVVGGPIEFMQIFVAQIQLQRDRGGYSIVNPRTPRKSLFCAVFCLFEDGKFKLSLPGPSQIACQNWSSITDFLTPIRTYFTRDWQISSAKGEPSSASSRIQLRMKTAYQPSRSELQLMRRQRIFGVRNDARTRGYQSERIQLCHLDCVSAQNWNDRH